MNDKNKAILFEAIILVVSCIVTLTLFIYFGTKGFIKLSHYSIFLLFSPLGVYIIFGKYVYINGFVTMPIRIVLGLFYILIIPAIFLFCGYFWKEAQKWLTPRINVRARQGDSHRISVVSLGMARTGDSHLNFIVYSYAPWGKVQTV